MNGRALVSLAGLALLLAFPHAAEAGRSSGLSGDVYLTGQMVTAPAAFTYSINTPVVGAGVRLVYTPEGGNYGYAGSFEYGTGQIKASQTTGGMTDTYETDANTMAVCLGLEQYYDCCDFECGPDLYYENTKITYKYPSSPQDELKGVNTFGIGGHFGGAFRLSDNLQLFGENREILGYTSWSQDFNGTKDELKQWNIRSSWRGGLRYNPK